MTRTLRPRLAGLVAVALAAAAGLVGLSSPPASAALCSGKGVNVVVDFNGLGGGVQKGCAPSGANKPGNQVFPAAGFGLTYARNQPGFVCRVKGSPSNDPCVNTSPANAYWGLYWSDGKSGTWKYSSTGVGSVKVASGGFLAFSWQNGGADDAPSATPRNAQPAPTKAPTKSATKAPPKDSGGGQGSGQGGGTKATTAPKAPEPTEPATKSATKAAASATPIPARSRSPKSSASAKASASASASATASPSAASSTAAEDASPAVTSTEPTSSDFASTEEDGGLPAWVPIGVLVVLGGAAGAAVWWRKRTGAV
jgi:hypothetical protein